MDISPYLKFMVNKGASDLFISVGTGVHAKVEGRTRRLERESLTSEQVRELTYSLLNAEQIAEFERRLELNLGFTRDGLGRFRMNAYRQRGEIAMVIRYIKSDIPSFAALGLPESLGELITQPRGQIFITGATGSGKSTTLAAMVNFRNETLPGHILSIEDPIEFIHEHKRSVVDQREVGLDTLSYDEALMNALRQAPDVIVIGEIRDAPTMEHAHHFAETGHLCLSTLHANNTIQALERIVNFFPAAAADQVCRNVATHLTAIISQRLISGTNGRVVPAVEILRNTPRVAELISKGEFRELRDLIAKGDGHGMVAFDESLYRLFAGGAISEVDAIKNADSTNDLRLRIHMGKTPFDDQLISLETD